MALLVFFPILNSYDYKYIVRVFTGCGFTRMVKQIQSPA